MWVLQYSTWTIVTYPSYAFWGTALVTILADWMFLWYCSCLSTDFCLLGRLLSSSRQNGQHHTNTPDWVTFVSSLIKDPCTCTRSSCPPWRRFSFSIWLQWRKREGFSHEQCCECAASTWVFNFYAPRVLWLHIECTAIERIPLCTLSFGSLAFDLILCRSRLTGFFEGVMDDGDKQNKPTKIFSTNPLIYHKSKIENF